MKLLITGGAGFIGSALIRYIIKETDYEVLNIDKLTYAGNLESLSECSDSKRYSFCRIDICNHTELKKAIFNYRPNIIMHLAAESHVDRSIKGPADFIFTNIIGTFNLLEISRDYYQSLGAKEKETFRFHHISTDEVFGDLEAHAPKFNEVTPYMPSSPYSASKASSDHLVRAWERTYQLPVIITNCSNNYGPYQYPEKLIPTVILNALKGNKIPIYGNGLQIRDWLFVEDHAKALLAVALKGKIKETYVIGGNNEKANIDVVKTICQILDKTVSDKPAGIQSFSELITYVKDRAGHDKRYAIDSAKIQRELDWKPIENFETGIQKTINWYLNNATWVKSITQKMHQG